MSNSRVKVTSFGKRAITTETLKLMTPDLMASRKFMRALSMYDRFRGDNKISPLLINLLQLGYNKGDVRNIKFNSQSNHVANGVYNLNFKNVKTDTFNIIQRIPVVAEVKVLSFSGTPKTKNTFQVVISAEPAVFDAIGKGITIDVGDRRGEHQIVISGLFAQGSASNTATFNAQVISDDIDYIMPSSYLTQRVGILNTQISPEGSLSGTQPIGGAYQETLNVGGMCITRVSQSITGSAKAFSPSDCLVAEFEDEGKKDVHLMTHADLIQTAFQYMSNQLLYGKSNVNYTNGEVYNTLQGEDIKYVASHDGLLNILEKRGSGAIYWHPSMSSQMKASIFKQEMNKISNMFDHFGQRADVCIYADELFYQGFYLPALEYLNSKSSITNFQEVKNGYIDFVGETYGSYMLPNGRVVKIIRTSFAPFGASTSSVVYNGVSYAKDKGTAIVMPLFEKYDYSTGNQYKNIELLTAGSDGVERGLVLAIEKGVTSAVSNKLNALLNGKMVGNVENMYSLASNGRDSDRMHILLHYGLLVQDTTGIGLFKCS